MGGPFAGIRLAKATAGEASAAGSAVASLMSSYPQLPLVSAAVKLRLGRFAAAIASLEAPLSLETGGMDHAAGAASAVLQAGAAAAQAEVANLLANGDEAEVERAVAEEAIESERHGRHHDEDRLREARCLCATAAIALEKYEAAAWLLAALAKAGSHDAAAAPALAQSADDIALSMQRPQSCFKARDLWLAAAAAFSASNSCRSL